MVRVGVTLYNDGVTVRPLPPAADAQGPPRTPCQPARLTAPGQCTRTQLSCPIGFAKSEQKHECCYAALANLPPRHRFSKNAIQLLELTNSKAFKRYDAACVLSGVRSEPMASASASRASPMTCDVCRKACGCRSPTPTAALIPSRSRPG